MYFIDFLEPTRSERRSNDGSFEFCVQVGEKVWTYLTTNSKSKKSIENGKDNFSSFYILNDDNTSVLGVIGFSTEGISLFDKNYMNQQDIKISRNSEKYRTIEKMEKSMRSGNKLSEEDLELLKNLWAFYKDTPSIIEAHT